MLAFFVIFVVTGVIIGFVIDDVKNAIVVISVLSIAWIFVYGPWAIATFIELILGYSLVKKLKD